MKMSYLKGSTSIYLSFIILASCFLTKVEMVSAKENEASMNECIWVCNYNNSVRADIYRKFKADCENSQKQSFGPMQMSDGCTEACYLDRYEDICENGRSCEWVRSKCDWNKYKYGVQESLSLTNTARYIGNGRWEWTAFITGPPNYLQNINSVTYYLHHTFSPNIYTGNKNQQGHPITMTGWGTFEVRARVVFNDGQQRMYYHMLRF
jgi:hypothetical protein